jgi:nucleotide-binding universal stress UspA family protein
VAKRILVPLDRKPGSEAVLPLVAGVAQHAGSTVRLVEVVPVPEGVVSEYGRVVASADQQMARLEAEASSHLEEVEANLDGVPAERVVRFGDPATEILVEAEVWEADLIAMTVPRGNWLGRNRRGSVADKVFRKAVVPVLLYRPR